MQYHYNELHNVILHKLSKIEETQDIVQPEYVLTNDTL